MGPLFKWLRMTEEHRALRTRCATLIQSGWRRYSTRLNYRVLRCGSCVVCSADVRIAAQWSLMFGVGTTRYQENGGLGGKRARGAHSRCAYSYLHSKAHFFVVNIIPPGN